jgi:hypothetical protein
MVCKFGTVQDSQCGDMNGEGAHLSRKTDVIQDAGHHQATVYKAARSLSKSYGSAWTFRYVSPPFCHATTTSNNLLAKPKPKEEQHQFPPFENVPQDCRSPQAGLVHPHLSVHYAQRRTYESASWEELQSLLEYFGAFLRCAVCVYRKSRRRA